MLIVETIARIRRAHFVQGKPIKAICRELKISRKPGAWRNGAPFKDWILPASIEKIRRRLSSATDGDRQMVTILTAVLSDGLPAV